MHACMPNTGLFGVKEMPLNVDVLHRFICVAQCGRFFVEREHVCSRAADTRNSSHAIRALHPPFLIMLFTFAT